ncbi:hypothetical protein, conserved [Eimeria brunetti]|uniref:Uncharacterized protein n=1 Tax=Eimeria brunetti TaxID=51314 RepID=U6L714_9EIME|nr:hypothetical protein, conserved [Eimeria brunetti]
MGLHSQPIQEDVLFSFDSVEKGMVSDSKYRTKFDCDKGGACVPRPSKKKSSFVSSVHLLGVTFTSLSIVYVLLRCFESTGEIPRVAPLTRSLAAGGGRECYGVGNDGENEEDEEDATREAFWAAGLEDPAAEQSARGLYGHLRWHTGGPVRWPSMLTTTDEEITTTGAGLQEEGQGFFSGKGVGPATSVQEFHAADLHDADPPEPPRGQEVPESPLRKTRPPQVKGTGKQWSKESRRTEIRGVELREGEQWEMWEARNLPPFAEKQVVHLLHRMMYSASLCRRLLPRLTQSQRLRLSREVVRLLSLQLGAFSLVKGVLQELRVKLGDILVVLAGDALKRGGNDNNLEEYRKNLKALQSLIQELKNPRPPTERNSPYTYRAKMISLLRTATEVVIYVEGVLEGLYMYEPLNGCKPPSELVSQQISILWKLFEAHCEHIARDTGLRHYIIACQKTIGMRPLLAQRHLGLSLQDLPPMKHLVDGIHRIVEAAGGLIQLPPQPTSTHQSPPPSLSTLTQQEPALHEPAGEERRHTQQQELFVPASQPSPITTSMALHTMQATVPHTLPTQPHTSSHSPTTSSGQTRYAPRNAEGRSQQSQSLQSVLRLPVPVMHPPPPGFNGELQRPQHVSDINGKLPTGLPPAYASGHGGGGAAVLPQLATPQDSLLIRRPYPQQLGPVFVGAPAYVEVPRHPSPYRHSTSDNRTQFPLLPVAARRTQQPSGDTPSFDSETAPHGDSHQQEAEPVEEVQGLLAELLKGGVDPDYISGRKRP